MENYTAAELDVVALTNAETVSVSSITQGENELPIDPGNKNGKSYSLA